MGELNDRNQPAQHPPRPGLDFTGFPTAAIDAPEMYRVTNGHHEPWYFVSRPDPQDGTGGRFDLPSPRGTCYWAETREGGLREVIGPFLAEHGWVSAALLHDRWVAVAPVPESARMANLEHPDANRVFGVVADLPTAPDYTIPQLWAEALDGGGLDGISFRARYSGPGRPNAYAFFGPAGLDESRDAFPSKMPITEDVLAAAGITVYGKLEDALQIEFTVAEPPAM